MGHRSDLQWLVALTVGLVLLCGLRGTAAPPLSFAKGDLVRLTRSETLIFKGRNFLGAPKGQEFTVLQHDFRLNAVYVSFVNEDGTLIAATLPPDALESAPPDAWHDLARGVEAFREMRTDDARRLLTRAAQNEELRPVAALIAGRITGFAAAATMVRSAPAARAATARQAFTTSLQAMRDAAEQLSKAGYLSLALALDEGAERFANAAVGGQAAGLPPSKLDRSDVGKRVAVSNRNAARARQAIALRRLMEASALVKEGLEAEPNRPDLKRMETLIKRGITDAEDSYKSADSMRRFEKGAIHALTALERGLKYCADHPQLIALKKEMQSSWEGRTAPQVTGRLATAGPVKALEEGRHLYTTRCTECHDLELLDSRTMSSWQSIVSGMARRANVDAQQQARILAYIAAAQTTLAD